MNNAITNNDKKKKSVKASDPNEPQSLEQFISLCDSSPHRHIQLIGSWAQTTKPDLKTRGQWNVFLKRYLRPAKQLAEFSDEQIEQAFGKIRTAQEDGWLTKYSMETLIKFLI